MLDMCVCCLTKNPAQCRTLGRYVDLLKTSFHMKLYVPMEEAIICRKCAHLLRKMEHFHRKLKMAQHFFERLGNNNTKGIKNEFDETTGAVADVEGEVPEAAGAPMEEMPTLFTEGGTVKSEFGEFAEALPTEAFVQICPEQKEGERFNVTECEKMQDDARTTHNATSVRSSVLRRKLKHARKNITNRLPYKLDSKDRTCPLCREHFAFFRELSDHMHTHFPNNLCDTCGKLCATRLSLRSHMLTHLTEKHNCKLCGKEYAKSSTLREHDRIAHKGEKKTYKCKECKEVFVTNHRRVIHRIEAHGYEEKRFKCSECHKRYNHGSHLRAHVRNEHRKEKKAQCDQCQFAFFSRSALKKHMISHSKEKNHECIHCSKTYLRRSSVKQHLKIHENKKEFVCPVCEKAFTQKVTLKKHSAIHKAAEPQNKSQEAMNTLSSMLKKL